MKTKLYITRGIKLIAFALAVILTTYLLQSFLLKRIDDNTMRMEAFYLEDKGSLDAVVIGASDVYAGYSAPYAYDTYGITSYPYATMAAPANIVLPQIKEVIKYQDPKMIVVEINSFLYTDNGLPNESMQRMFADYVPKDEIWKEYLDDAVPAEKQMEYYASILKFHGAWKDYPWKIKYLLAELSLKKNGYSLFRGYKTITNEFHPTVKVYNDQLADNDKKLPLSVNGERYLKQTLEYLKENNIKNVVFMRFPHIVDNGVYLRFLRCNQAAEIIESYGYDFVNLERYGYDAGFDVNKDFYNMDHLNIHGTEKLTDYVVKMLMNDYGITPAELTQKQKDEWAVSVNYYHMVYNYTDAVIYNRNKGGKNESGGAQISEDEESIKTIEEHAKKYPDKGKYPVDPDLIN